MQPTGDFQNVLKIKPPLCVSRESVNYSRWIGTQTFSRGHTDATLGREKRPSRPTSDTGDASAYGRHRHRR
jgi:hypothetical protein